MRWETRVGPLHGGDGAVTGTVLVLRDVTAQQRAQEETAGQRMDDMIGDLVERSRSGRLVDGT